MGRFFNQSAVGKFGPKVKKGQDIVKRNNFVLMTEV